MEQVQGVVVGLIAGFYDVEVAGKVVRTRARGVFRKTKEKPAVGDQVEVQLDPMGTSYLQRILPRLNRIGRPAVANVSHVLLVISAVEPDFSPILLDRFLTFFNWQNVAVSVYLSKTDLISPDQLAQLRRELSYYQQLGYSVYFVPAELQLAQRIQNNQIWTLAGQSGAGKSTLLNQVAAQAQQATSAISKVLNHGKHTTRKVELFQLGGGFLADTPGFSAIDLTPIKLTALASYFSEFASASQHCQFRGCQHLQEPKCAVKRALAAGQISASRYQHYLDFRSEIAAGRTPEYLK